MFASIFHSFSLCRNLLILQQLLVDNFTLNSTALEVIRSRCIPETVIFLQAYYVMGWISVAATNFTSSQG
jgi:nuclear pore complex protein Nup160